MHPALNYLKNGLLIPMRVKNIEPSRKRQEAKNQLETLLTELAKLLIRKSSSAIGIF